ncbi:MAG: hypothetical protein Q4E36_01060 [Bacillota bacterium]|nr:hypothetical protein [Bacillota bacterium]
MKKTSKAKYLLLVLGLIFLVIVLNKLIVDRMQRPVKMVETESIWQDVEIQKAKLTDSSIVTWDNSSIKIYNLQGDLVEEILGNGYYTNIYFFNNEIGVLDKQLNVFYLYSSLGDLKEKIELTGSVYSVINKEGSFFVHRKDQLQEGRLESLSKLETRAKESPLYETERFIINFDIDNSKLYVSEITTENYSYKSVLSIIDGKESSVFDFGNETVLETKVYGKRLLALTNKNLYNIVGNERKKVELKNFKDYRFEDKKILVLYDNKLVLFNPDLTIDKSVDIGITTSGLLVHDGSYFVWGPTDIVGFVGEQRTFTKSFESIVYGVDSNDKGLLVTHKYNTELYLFELIEEEKN